MTFISCLLNASSSLLWFLWLHFLCLPWIIFLSPPFRYWDYLRLCLWPSFLTILFLLHGPSHPLPYLHANDSQVSISILFYYFYILLYKTACSVLNTTFFSQVFLIEHFGGISTSLAIYLANTCTLIKVQIAHCIQLMPFLVLLETVLRFLHCYAQGCAYWSLIEYLPHSFCSRALCSSVFLLVCEQENRIQPCPLLYIEQWVQFLGHKR